MLIAVAENYEMTSFANSKTDVTCCCCRRLEAFINMELIFQDYVGIPGVVQATQEPYFMLYICASYFMIQTAFIKLLESCGAKGHTEILFYDIFCHGIYILLYFLSVCRLHHKANDRLITWDFRMHSSLSVFMLIFLRKESGRLMGLIKSDGCHGDRF
jgi:hypothetical protein